MKHRTAAILVFIEFRIRDGAHNWTYWREALPEVLGFISQGFHRQGIFFKIHYEFMPQQKTA